MASSPQFKIYHPQRGYIASMKDPSDAAAFACFLGAGTTVRLGHARTMTVLEVEPEDSRSFDEMAEVILRRIGRW